MKTILMPLTGTPICGSNEHAQKRSLFGRELQGGVVTLKDGEMVYTNHRGCPFCFDEKMNKENDKYKGKTIKQFADDQEPHIKESIYSQMRKHGSFYENNNGI